jgi:hypothetical protein
MTQTQRYDVLTPRPKKDGTTFWMRIGIGFARDDGGVMVTLDALPLPDKEGRVAMLISVQRERDAAPQQRSRQQPADDLGSDSIPF